MNNLNELEKEKKIKKYKKERDKLQEFSRVLLFAGENYNQELAQNKEIKEYNIIDFGKHSNEEARFIERKLREIYNNSDNKRFIEEKKFPIIWFKNIDKIEKKSSLEKSLLPVFDSQQNTELFNKEIDLSKFILVATTSTNDTAKLSDPLLSRLDWINVATAQTKKFFWDKNFKSLLIGSILVNLFFLLVLFVPKCKKHLIKWKCNCS